MAITETVGWRDVEATAINIDGYTVNQEYEPEILDYRRENTVFWQMIPEGNKRKARSATIQHVERNKRHKVGFVDRSDLSGAVNNPKTEHELDLNDPGEEVKALMGTATFDHFGRSLARQQNYPWTDEVATDTDDMLTETYRYLEMALFRGNASLNPFEFNGLQRQMPPSGHVFEVDLTTNPPDSIWKMMNYVVMKVAHDRSVLRKVTHFFVTGSAMVKLQEEVVESVLKFNQLEVIPGVVVPTVQTGDGQKPVISSPYLDDVADVDGTNSYDYLRIFAIDIRSVFWYGVIPDGGKETYEPQIFDLTQFQNNQYLVLKRGVLSYGTPKLLNQGLWRIDLKVPRGTAWNTVETP